MSKKVERLKVVDIKKNGVIVSLTNGETGFIHISEVSHGFVEDLGKLFKIGEIIYGVKKKNHYGKTYYSLKVGHTMHRDVQKKFKVSENGGGYLGLIHLQNSKLQKSKRRNND